ncbi:MAG TPA: FtsX-like permease family protein [Gemmatimonadaceae bacterium]|nr:FtsX-like permease family protein [Gemmatimonadaceae bacterium]
MIVRLRSEAIKPRADAEVAAIAKHLSAVRSPDRPGLFVLRSVNPDPLRLQTYQGAMVGAALSILLIACGNVAALMLARGVRRRRDQALRLALGASRRTLVADVIAEVTLLTVAGAAAGVLLAFWGLKAFTVSIPEELIWRGFTEPEWSGRVFAMTVIAVLASVLVASLFPAWQAARTHPAEPLKDNAGTTTGRAGSRFRALVVAELAMSMVLLVGASLIVKATQRAASFIIGFDPKPLLAGQIYVRAPTDTMAQRYRWSAKPVDEVQGALDRIRAVPGITDVAMRGSGRPDSNQIVSDELLVRGSFLFTRGYSVVGPRYFDTMGIRLKAGRDFTESDALGPGAVILDEVAVRELFPYGGALGRLVKLGDRTSTRPWVPVIGIAPTIQEWLPEDPDMLRRDPQIYSIEPQGRQRGWSFIARQSRAAPDIAVTIRRKLQDALPPRSYVSVTPFTRDIEEQLRPRRFLSGVFVLLGAVSLLMASAGLFAVLSYSVGERMREFAVRIALGARRSDILRLVLRDGLELALGGTALGAFGGMWAGQLLSKWLFGVHPADVVALVTAEAILVAVTMASCVAPAIRARQANPVDVLRAT